MASTSLTTVLRAALNQGDLDKTRELLDAGVSAKYTRLGGYDALMDVMCGRNISKCENLFPLVMLLIERGVKLNGISKHGETAIRTASWAGRFDVVKLLLDAGANSDSLRWTSLMHAIVFDSSERVEALLDDNPNVCKQQDAARRTPWLLCLQIGDIGKAELFWDTQVDGEQSLFAPIINDHAQVLSWLLSKGFSPDVTNSWGNTPLMDASEYNAFECVNVLLTAGADVNKTNDHGSNAMKEATSLEMVSLLQDAGADLNDINDEMHQRLLLGEVDDVLNISKEAYQSGKMRQFGESNPQIMHISFWREMVRTGINAWKARMAFEDTYLTSIASTIEGDDAETFSQYINVQQIDPVWTFQRFGKSITPLPDGRYVEIGGEYEDSYDADFCIYNDVVVFDGAGGFIIYCYPPDIFPPTDFHSATLVGGDIYIIGSLGYPKIRRYGETQVYRLHIGSFKIEKLTTKGQNPGWIHRHKAHLENNAIHISNGKSLSMEDGVEQFQQNEFTYILDLHTLCWSCQ